jgi:hypothetical protein
VICKKKTNVQRISHRPNTYLSPIAPKESTLKSTQKRQLNLHEKLFTNSFFLPQETLVFGYWVFVTVKKQWILRSLLDELGVVTHNSSCGRSHNWREKECVFLPHKRRLSRRSLNEQSQSADMGVFYPWRKKRTSIQVGPFFLGKELTEWISNQLVILSNYAIHFFLNKSPLPQFSSTTSWAELSSALEWVSRAQFMTY